jgi:hypothetical protein
MILLNNANLIVYDIKAKSNNSLQTRAIHIELGMHSMPTHLQKKSLSQSINT